MLLIVFIKFGAIGNGFVPPAPLTCNCTLKMAGTGNDNLLFTARFPSPNDLQCRILSTKANSSGPQSIQGKCRELARSDAAILLLPRRDCPSAFIVGKVGYLTSDKFTAKVHQSAFQVSGEDVELEEELLVSCYIFTAKARMTPKWNSVGRWTVQGMGFLDSSKSRAVDMQATLRNRELKLSIRPLSLLCQQLTPADLEVSLRAVQAFEGRQKASIEETEMEGRRCIVLPNCTQAYVKSVSHAYRGAPVLPSYNHLRLYWKRQHGYVIPECQGLHYQVYFPANPSSAMSYPGCCVLSCPPRPSKTREAPEIASSFIGDLRQRLPSVCGGEPLSFAAIRVQRPSLLLAGSLAPGPSAVAPAGRGGLSSGLLTPGQHLPQDRHGPRPLVSSDASRLAQTVPPAPYRTAALKSPTSTCTPTSTLSAGSSRRGGDQVLGGTTAAQSGPAHRVVPNFSRPPRPRQAVDTPPAASVHGPSAGGAGGGALDSERNKRPFAAATDSTASFTTAPGAKKAKSVSVNRKSSTAGGPSRATGTAFSGAETTAVSQGSVGVPPRPIQSGRIPGPVSAPVPTATPVPRPPPGAGAVGGAPSVAPPPSRSAGGAHQQVVPTSPGLADDDDFDFYPSTYSQSKSKKPSDPLSPGKLKQITKVKVTDLKKWLWTEGVQFKAKGLKKDDLVKLIVERVRKTGNPFQV